ncbi:HAMP domain-containing histidine kinase [Petralouisia muris]|jgi:signal transduction histidine kinase|uniref:HAMP domain-containing histidine kinase n=1 Tax=Petralouisia muris TaxID=3032872 RepID=A0AC61RVG4_9FIRM|nr:HAMP domain-containing sensor histidine kinase [Petralouisia muris]TGY95936.1 HAMP domain-containing histidine kinase [Petralouisia muris]
MDMIKKIAFTASTMLFVLTQVFSFYVIFTSRQEKIDLLKEKERKIYEGALSNFNKKMSHAELKAELSDHVIIYCFRENMPENSALYKEKEELYNSSPYEFDVNNINLAKVDNTGDCVLEKSNNKYILVFFQNDAVRYYQRTTANYTLFYAVDVTYIYEKSRNLVIQEFLISCLASLAMALLLVFLIKKITRPLQVINETQRQLIGSMSHELKTPLTAMKGYSETLLSVKLSPEQEEKSLRYIHQESGRLSRLTEKMMELTRLYEPECKIQLQEVSVEHIFQAVEDNVIYGLQETGIHLKREGDYQGRMKKLDADLMTSFLINLINNSIMASSSGGSVYLGADEHSLWVRDEGCGIPPEEVDKVRKAFYRVDKSRSRKSGNMGLGLALCDQIAAVHHGTMKIESKVGEGTKISIIL